MGAIVRNSNENPVKERINLNFVPGHQKLSVVELWSDDCWVLDSHFVT